MTDHVGYVGETFQTWIEHIGATVFQAYPKHPSGIEAKGLYVVFSQSGRTGIAMAVGAESLAVEEVQAIVSGHPQIVLIGADG